MKRRHSPITVLVLASSIAVLGACTAILGDFTTSASVADSGPTSDVLTETSVDEGGVAFSITAPATIFVQPGKTASLAIAVQGATNGPITVTATALPAGVTAAPLTIAQGSSTGNLVLTAAASATIGTEAKASISATAAAAGAPAVTLDVTISGQSGTVDTTFPKTIPFGSGLGLIASALVQPDGKLVLFGTFHATPGDAPSLAMRLNTDGTVDSTFQSLIFTSASASPIAVGLKGILQPDGKILVAWTEGASSYLNVTRLMSTGALDGTWHDPTKATVSTIDQMFVATNPELMAFGRGADGSVIYAQIVTGGVNVWRWNSNGVADTTIGTLGDYGRTEIGPAHPVLDIDDLDSLQPQPDGTVYFTGFGVNESGFSAEVFARTTSALTLDPGFGPLPDAGDGDAGGWESGFRFFLPYEATMIGNDLYQAAEQNVAGCTVTDTLCTIKWTLGPDARNSETVCPNYGTGDGGSGLGCGDYAVRITQGPNKTILTGGFSTTLGGIPVVVRFTTSPLATDLSYGTGGVAKLRASASTAAVELPVAIAATTEGLVYVLTQDAQYPIQRIWP
ncbi:MAG: delta-60 repeat domain-containing protein [Polyangiaceae bacterium]